MYLYVIKFSTQYSPNGAEGFFGFFLNLVVKKKRPAGEAIEKLLENLQQNYIVICNKTQEFYTIDSAISVWQILIKNS